MKSVSIMHNLIYKYTSESFDGRSMFLWQLGKHEYELTTNLINGNFETLQKFTIPLKEVNAGLEKNNWFRSSFGDLPPSVVRKII